MNSRTLSMEDYYLPNKWVPFTAAFGFHIFLMIWDPTILKASPYTAAAQVITVRVMERMPVMEPVKPKVVPPPPKHVEKKHPVKKAKKSGLSMSTKAKPMAIIPHRKPAHVAPPAPKPFVSKITMPKFVPRETEEAIAASPVPGTALSSPHRAVRAFVPAPKLTGKSRGVRANDIPFQLSDRGSIAGAGTRIVAIPIGEERGEVASLPSAPMIHDAPKGSKAVAGFRFTPGQGSGSGELSGHDKGGHIGYHGVARADTYIEGSLNGTNGNGKGGGKVVTGKGFEIGGPVGDRHITHRKLPEYPAWAEEKGISAMVKIYFTVKPDGSLRQNMRIVTSSGYAELDDLAKQALLQWKFSPTSADSNEQTAWGVITFRFTLA